MSTIRFIRSLANRIFQPWYARDDVGGEYDGLYAMLVCRAVLGQPFVTEKPGNYADKVTSGDFDCVVGDREHAVGTFREFVFFREASIYPEFAVFYPVSYTHLTLPTILLV